MKKVGLIGIGHMGSFHLAILNSIAEKINFVGVYDLNQQKAKQLCEGKNFKSFSSIDDLLSETEAVILATPTETHYSIAKKILASGKHLLVEKPITDNYLEAEELFLIAKKNNLYLQIGHVERYNAAVQEVENWIEQPLFWRSQRVGPYNGRITDTGVVMDLLIHDIDICIRLLKDEIINISADGLKIHGEHEDLANVQITFKKGCIANFLVSRISHEKKRSLKILQKNNSIALDYSNQQIEIYKNTSFDSVNEIDTLKQKESIEVKKLAIAKDNPLRLEILDFLDKIGSNYDYSQDLKVLETVIKIQKIITKKFS